MKCLSNYGKSLIDIGTLFFKYSIFSSCCHFVQHNGTHVVLVEGILGIRSPVDPFNGGGIVRNSCVKWFLTINAPIATKVICFSHLLICLRSLYGKQCGPRSDCCSGSTLFASILNLQVLLGNYFQQTTSADDIFRCIFFLGTLRVNLG